MIYATIEDLTTLWRELKVDEVERATALLEVVSASLDLEAKKANKSLETMISESASFKTVLKSVVVDIVARTLMTSTEGEPMTQTSESALGYSWSGTYLVPGGGLFIKDSELKRLGLLKNAKYGVINWYDEDKGCDYYFNQQG